MISVSEVEIDYANDDNCNPLMDAGNGDGKDVSEEGGEEGGGLSAEDAVAASAEAYFFFMM